MRVRTLFALLFVGLLVGLPVLAIEEEVPPAGEGANTAGGVQVVTGRMTVSNPNVITATVEPVIILEDQTGFVMRDLEYEFEEETQVIAQFPDGLETYQEGYLDYRIPLPITPTGNFHDVDNDNVEETGVQIFQTAYWDNTRGTPYIGPLEGYAWSGAYSSARVSEDPTDESEIVGGKLLIYAADDEQSFPSGFGEDGLLFTDDDPIVDIEAGYTAVNLDTDPFTFDRSSEVVFDLIEPAGFVPVDFSDMSYTEAFDALIEYAREAYVFTDLKGLDWDELSTEFRPLFVAAEENNDNDAYILALRAFIESIPDAHVNFGTPYANAFNQEFQEQVSGGLGFAVTELDDGRVIVTYLTAGGPAEAEGVELGAELLSISGMEIEEAIQSARAFSAPFSTEEAERIQQVRYVTRFPIGTDVEFTYQNPDADEATTLTITTVQEFESFNATSVFAGFDDTDLPLNYDFLDNGYAYFKVQTLSGNEGLIFEVFDYFMEQVQLNGTEGIIIDLRQNSGGFSGIGLRMASYFFDEEIELYYSEEFVPELGEFYTYPIPATIRPELAPEELRFDGELVVLVGPACSSACEFLGYQLTANDRATVIGQYASGGLAGGWFPLYMPDDVTLALPTNRDIDVENGEIIIEGIGIQPDIRVPVTEETIFSDGDPVLEAAVDYLDGATTVEATDAGEIGYEEEVTGTLELGSRVTYTFEIVAGEATNIFLSSDDFDAYLRIYDSSGETILAESDDIDADTLNAGVEIPALDDNLEVLIEVASFDDEGSGDYTLTITTDEAP